MQNTQLYPVVEINGIWYSTNNVTVERSLAIPDFFGGGFMTTTEYCKPILMNIPSIKESVDIESRKFKISNVSLQFNNFPFEGVRFSDQLSETSLINKEATVYFKSQSELKEVFKGIVRRLSHDDEKVKVELEDLTEKNAHKDLPQAIDQNGVVGYLGDGDDVPEKYKNKAIPIVYGHVEKSPLVVDGNYSIIRADSKMLYGATTTDSLFTDTGGDIVQLDPLIIDDDGENLHVRQLVNGVSQYDFMDNYFSYKSGNYAYVTSKPKIKFSISSPDEPTTSGLLNEDFLLPGYQESSIFNIFNQSYSQNNIGLTGNRIETGVGGGFFVTSYKLLELTLDYGSMPSLLDGSNPDILGFKINNYNLINYASGDTILSSGAIDDPYNDYPTDYDITDTDSPHYSEISSLFGFKEYNSSAGGTVYGIEEDINPDAAIQISLDRVGSTSEMLIRPQQNYIRFKKDLSNRLFKISLNTKCSVYFQGIPIQEAPFLSDSTMEQTAELEGDLNEIELLINSIPTDVFKKDFYANVKGRINTFDDHPDGIADEEFIENPIDIIYDLVRSEIGHDNIDEAEYAEAKLAHDGWKFGFTVNKKISSKKLIEDIAKSTKCFPKFKNDGSFGFNTVKDSYTYDGVDSDYAGAIPIKESEVISYSFKKTKPEQIYQKVDVQYNKDYAQDSYLKRTPPRIGIESDGTVFTEQIDFSVTPNAVVSEYNASYYGLNNPNRSSTDTYLEFESDYIRDKDTAEDLREFLYYQYSNNHLILNLKLPLQYIDLEIGDLVKFESLFQGVKAYGIDYRVCEPVNGQYRYPLFMVTSTTKNLDSVSIECMQLHHLDHFTNPEGWNDLNNSFPDADTVTIEPYLFAPDVATTEFQETDDSIETNNVFVYKHTYGNQGSYNYWLVNKNLEGLDFTEHNGDTGEEDIFSYHTIIQIKSASHAFITRVGVSSNNIANSANGVQAFQLSFTSGYSIYNDDELLENFLLDNEDSSPQTLEITRVTETAITPLSGAFDNQVKDLSKIKDITIW